MRSMSWLMRTGLSLQLAIHLDNEVLNPGGFKSRAAITERFNAWAPRLQAGARRRVRTGCLWLNRPVMADCARLVHAKAT